MSAAANYSMDQSFLDFCSCFYHDNPTVQIVYIQKKVSLKRTQPKYLSKLTFESEEWSSQLIFQFEQLERRSLKKKIRA